MPNSLSRAPSAMSSVGSAAAVASQGHWAALCSTWPLIALLSKGAVFSILLFSILLFSICFHQKVMMGWALVDVMHGLQMLSCCIVGLSVGCCHPQFALRCCSTGSTCVQLALAAAVTAVASVTRLNLAMLASSCEPLRLPFSQYKHTSHQMVKECL